MSGRVRQRTIAGLSALGLFFIVVVAMTVLPMPYVVYSPGLTVDVLGDYEGDDIVQVTGHRTYRDDGGLEMTTVYVTPPQGHVSLPELMRVWVSGEEAAYPYASIYPPDLTAEQKDQESAVQMVSSQDLATAVALRKLDYDLKEVVEVQHVADDMPAADELQVRDVIVAIDGTKVKQSQDVVDGVTAADGDPVTFTILRKGKRTEVTIKPDATEDGPKVGIIAGPGYDFPFDVKVNIDPDIGGPSAGLMFSLGIYDVLTPGSMTGGHNVAGTGTIDETGSVGSIGGIEQKIVAARESGAELFLVPPDNCAEATYAANGDMRLVKADTMSDAVDAIEAWADDPDTTLPTCSDEESS